MFLADFWANRKDINFIGNQRHWRRWHGPHVRSWCLLLKHHRKRNDQHLKKGNNANLINYDHFLLIDWLIVCRFICHIGNNFAIWSRVFLHLFICITFYFTGPCFHQRFSECNSKNSCLRQRWRCRSSGRFLQICRFNNNLIHLKHNPLQNSSRSSR